MEGGGEGCGGRGMWEGCGRDVGGVMTGFQGGAGRGGERVMKGRKWE